MVQTDIENEYLTENERRRFGLQRFGMHLLLWPLTATTVVATWLTFSAPERAMGQAKAALQERLETVRLARLEFCEIKKQVLLHQEGLITTAGMSDRQKALQLGRVVTMRDLLSAEAKLAEVPVRLDDKPEAMTWVRNSDGTTQILNATADGRLGAVPTPSVQTLQAIAVQAIHRAEAEQAKNPRQILVRDLTEIHAQVAEILANDAAK